MNWVGAILAIGLLIVVHEAGHYVVARWCSMRVERFSIGFGPAIIGRRSKKTGTMFQIAPIPFGGFVEIKGMNIAEEVDPDDVHAYPNRPAWQRFATIFAGPATNYLTAIVLALGLYTCAGVQSTERWYGVDSVNDGYDAKGKLESGDRILAVDGKEVWLNGPHNEQVSLGDTVNAKRGAMVTLTVLRAGKLVTVPVTPKFDNDTKIMRYRLGIVLTPQAERVDVGVVGAVRAAIIYPIAQTKLIVGGLYEVIRGNADFEVHSGVGMADMVKKAFDVGWIQVFELMMMLNVYLGMFNLFPLPALDGGRLVFLGYEMATRRRANPKIETTVHMVGILLLVVLMVLVTFKDCMNL